MSYKAKLDDMRNELRVMYKTIPDATQGFGVLSKAVKDNGPLDLKTKEFIALGMAVVQRCEPCIMFHTEALMKAGGTREELGDVLAMAIQMAGGPGVMYAGHALACWDELAAKA
ncbi:carboxymuconolactone decarboxylase family protein [Sedimentimonas flavescens]|uniref:Carboxymuconolactone decarboxylase family protein n=1 Tax=Sedimentimonas flavescens TaxID=2851012 RepID=A0ABT2ZUV1_9RHOB|nr:carboxymuconolactone decarboxylase family protein [Sedimentimonas flavescens]MBW0156707.1 carboxymuconolactone decarboxylase family protein [Sedimentimonas flavescens]MCT2539201.1 carboxymuconolactone decarboxylase family protein [Sedimentimonas flavescens]MCV2877519.1 carboxymuconolactone decarboxylase family protein [Sedimentimonas flavescens]WBL32470.1 carboxymuconolactone decarboxylase family protein [Sinirhodobacter sp. HNIBRBA609]